MGKGTYTDNHDWLAVRASFPGGTKANFSWSRGGEKVEVPGDAARSLQLSYIVTDAKTVTGEGKPFRNLGEVGKRIAATADRSASIDDFIANLRTDLGVKGEPPKARNAAHAPCVTQATLSPNRGGHLLKATFPNGDHVELKLNASSVGLRMDPNIPSFANDLMKFAFGVKQTGLLPPQEFANTLLEAAKSSGGAVEWLEGVKEALRPSAPKP